MKFSPGLPEPWQTIACVALGLRTAKALRRFAAFELRVGPEISVEILFRGEIGAPRGDTAAAIVERTDNAPTRRISVRLKPIMSPRRSIDSNDGAKRADTAVVAAVDNDLPTSIFAQDLDNGNTVRRHLDLDEFCGHIWETGQVLAGQTGEHDLFIGIFVIYAEKPAVTARIERKEGNVVVVVAELLELRRRALFVRIEGKRIREERIAPSEQYVSLVAFGNMMRFIYAGLDFIKAEPVFRYRRNAARERRRAEQRGGGDNAKAAADDVAAAVAPLDDVSNRVQVSRAQGHVIMRLKGFSPVAEEIGFRHEGDRYQRCARLGVAYDRFAKNKLLAQASCCRRHPPAFAKAQQQSRSVSPRKCGRSGSVTICQIALFAWIELGFRISLQKYVFLTSVA